MGRLPLLALTWLAGTAVSVLVGSTGVALVASVVTPPQVPPLSRPEVATALLVGKGGRDLLTASPITTAPAPAAPESLPPGRPIPSAPAPAAPESLRPVSSTTTVEPSAAGRVAPPAIESPASSAQAISPSDRSTDRASTSSTAPFRDPGTDRDPDAAVTRTISSVGGSLVVRFESGRVRLVWARPDDGFAVNVDEGGPERVQVSFTSENHRSLIRAWWNRGTPSQRVKEEAGGGEDTPDPPGEDHKHRD